MKDYEYSWLLGGDVAIELQKDDLESTSEIHIVSHSTRSRFTTNTNLLQGCMIMQNIYFFIMSNTVF